jgi:hypothetical protein
LQGYKPGQEELKYTPAGSTKWTDLVECGAAAASELFPEFLLNREDRALELAIPLVWLIWHLYRYNKPLAWRLANKSREFQAICDRAPVPLANMKIGIPSMFGSPEFSVFDRVWVGSLEEQKRFSPRIKMTGLGFRNLKTANSSSIRVVEKVTVVAPDSDRHSIFSDKSGLLRTFVKQLSDDGMSVDEIYEALNPNVEYWKSGRIQTLSLKFDWPLRDIDDH